MLLLNLINKFTKQYGKMLSGESQEFVVDELIGAARINYIFEEIYKKAIQNINPFDQLSDDHIRTAIKNANGLTPALFLPEGAFTRLVRQQIKRILQPSLECSYLVHEELRKMIK